MRNYKKEDPTNTTSYLPPVWHGGRKVKGSTEVKSASVAAKQICHAQKGSPKQLTLNSRHFPAVDDISAGSKVTGAGKPRSERSQDAGFGCRATMKTPALSLLHPGLGILAHVGLSQTSFPHPIQLSPELPPNGNSCNIALGGHRCTPCLLDLEGDAP